MKHDDQNLEKFKAPVTLGAILLSLSACNPLILNPVIQSNFNPGVPQLAIHLPSSLLYPISAENPPAIQGNQFSLPISAQGNGLVSLSCSYETVGLSPQDPNYVAPGDGTGCEELDTLSTSVSGTVSITHGVSQGIWLSQSGTGLATAAITWTPNSRQRGTYRFILTASNTNSGSVSESIYVTVRENYTSAQMGALFDATASDVGTAAAIANTPVEPRLTVNNNNTSTGSFSNAAGSLVGNLDFGNAAPYQGTGRSSTVSVDPYALKLNGTNDSLDLGGVLQSFPQFAIETWVNATSSSTADSVIASNAEGTATGEWVSIAAVDGFD